MDSCTEKLKGVIVPLVTPVDDIENVDEAAFRAVIRRCINGGVSGFFAGGSAGMGPLLADEQWRIAMETAYDEIGDSHILLGSAIETSTIRAIEKITTLESIGFKHVVVTPTYYITLNDESEFLTHFDKCRQTTDMDMVVYNIPSCTYSNIPLKVLEKMAREGWFRTMKESSGDRSYFQSVVEVTNSYNINILQGSEVDIEWGLFNGASGIVPVCANYEPETFVAAWESAQKNDHSLLAAAQNRIDYLRDMLLVKSENWISGIMYGVHSLGFGNGSVLSPLCEVTEESRRRIDLLENVDVRKDKLIK
jgi:4-hydroxy-tetrahydrodipicolinate synthase